jgi:hypothetical protein
MLDAIKGTPLFVWAIFVLLLIRGVQGMKTKTIFFPKILILPTVLFLFSIAGILSQYGLNIFAVGGYVIALLLGILTRWLFVHNQKLEIDKVQRTITVPGTASTLFLILAIFTIKYIFGYLHAVNPELAQNNMYFISAEITLSGLITGLFLGKALNYIYKYIQK